MDPNLPARAEAAADAVEVYLDAVGAFERRRTINEIRALGLVEWLRGRARDHRAGRDHLAGESWPPLAAIALVAVAALAAPAAAAQPLTTADLPGAGWLRYHTQPGDSGICGFQMPGAAVSAFLHKGSAVRPWAADFPTHRAALAAWRANEQRSRYFNVIEGVGMTTTRLRTPPVRGLPAFGLEFHVVHLKTIGGYLVMLRGRHLGEAPLLGRGSSEKLLRALAAAQAAKLT